MSLTLVTAPSAEPLTLEEVKLHLRVEVSTDNALISAIIKAVRESIDGRDGWLGRALVTQTWDYTIHDFPKWTVRRGFIESWADFPNAFNDGPIFLPLAPVQSITSVKYTDNDGVEQTVDSGDYVLSADTHWRPRIDLAFDKVWPDTRDIPDAVTVRFVAGYGDVGTDVPETIRQGMLLTIGHLYENRQDVVGGVTLQRLPMGAQYLLMPYRRRGV